MSKRFKGKVVLIFVCFCFAQNLYAQSNKLLEEYNKNIKKAENFFAEKKYKKAAYVYSNAFKELGWKGKERDRYNAARAWCLADVPDSAFFCLTKIAEHGMYDYNEKILNDESLLLLHKDTRWQPLMILLAKNMENKLPAGWFKAGSKPSSYFMGLDAIGTDNKKVATIKSVDNEIEGFGTVMQNFLPDKYKGKRVKMTAMLKLKGVDDWAGLWLRVDGESSKNFLSFDNMKNGKNDRSVKGTIDWKQYYIILDVPEIATNIAFGALLVGTGQIWFDNFNFEIVDNNIETTGNDNSKTSPQNLYFGK